MAASQVLIPSGSGMRTGLQQRRNIQVLRPSGYQFTSSGVWGPYSLIGLSAQLGASLPGRCTSPGRATRPRSYPWHSYPGLRLL